MSDTLSLDKRIEGALRRIKNGDACMRIPADPADPDLVLHDCRNELAALVKEQEELRSQLDHEFSSVTKLLNQIRAEKAMYAELLMSFRWAEQEMTRVREAALKLPRPWIDGSIEFDEWIAAVDKVLEGMQK